MLEICFATSKIESGKSYSTSAPSQLESLSQVDVSSLVMHLW